MLLMGNEAVARGTIEAGIGVAAAYPGSPTSEVLPAIANVSKEMNIHAGGLLMKRSQRKWLLQGHLQE